MSINGYITCRLQLQPGRFKKDLIYAEGISKSGMDSGKCFHSTHVPGAVLTLPQHGGALARACSRLTPPAGGICSGAGMGEQDPVQGVTSRPQRQPGLGPATDTELILRGRGTARVSG